MPPTPTATLRVEYAEGGPILLTAKVKGKRIVLVEIPANIAAHLVEHNPDP